MEITPGKGGTVSGPATLTQNEVEASAAYLVACHKLGILPDSLEVPFSQINVHNTWKYSSDSSNPTLHPLSNLRMSAPSSDLAETGWPDQLALLINLLPDDIRSRLITESKLPLDERNPTYTAFSNVLSATAKVMAWIQMVSRPLSPEAQTLSRTSLNNALPIVVLSSVIDLGAIILNSAKNFLNGIGPNAEHFDQILGVVNRVEEAFQDLNDLSHPIGSNKQSLSLLAGDLVTLGNQLQSVSFGENLQALRTLVDVMATVTAAMASRTGSPSLLIGLTVANIGLQRTDGTNGVLSPGLTRLVDGLAAGLLSTSLPLADAGSRQLLSLLITSTLIGAVGFATSTISSQENGSLVLDLALLLGSGILTDLSTGIVQATGANEKTQGPAASALALFSMLAIMQTVAVDDRSAAMRLIESLSPQLKQLLSSIEPLVTDAVNAHENGSPIAHALAVFVQQGLIALDGGDFESFLETMGNAQAIAQGDSEETIDFKRNMQGLIDFIRIIERHSGPEEDNNVPITGIVQG